MTATTRAALIDAIAAGDMAAMAAYGDLLAEEGDPRGELFTLHALGGLAHGSREVRKRYARLRGTVSFLPPAVSAVVLAELKTPDRWLTVSGASRVGAVLLAHGHPLAPTFDALVGTLMAGAFPSDATRGHSTRWTACALPPHGGGGGRWTAGHGGGAHCPGAYPDAVEAILAALCDLMRWRTPKQDGGRVRVEFYRRTQTGIVLDT